MPLPSKYLYLHKAVAIMLRIIIAYCLASTVTLASLRFEASSSAVA
ncbi:MAG: hypothetical protein K0S01_888 [Herbinix sp.]|jgi:hypothetical protein|nr:hypothetical protein [Herbinix sp.]